MEHTDSSGLHRDRARPDRREYRGGQATRGRPTRPDRARHCAGGGAARRCARRRPGNGAEAGSALTSHPDIRGVFFTGGIASGREVIRSSAATIKNLAMELGGNDPAVILESATIDEAMVRELVAGSFGCAGQICFNVKRIYVHRRHFDEFVDVFTDLAGQIVVGDGFDPTVDFGPLATEDSYRRAHRLIDQARAGGAHVRTVGRYADSARSDEGYYVLPTVVTGLAADDELVVTEQFSPVIPILPFDSDEEAIAAANGTDFGLASSVWSQDLDHAMRVARRIESGSTFINVHRLGASVPSAPFGGIKQSGIGRTHGEHSLHACTEEHAIIRFADPTTDLPGIARWNHLRTTAPTPSEGSAL
ncbi:aldehyde dehydrogenase family protein [Rhodococcus opacus]|nr:aldehyde dehydrogenase family protein [Rhodococcus opacus]